MLRSDTKLVFLCDSISPGRGGVGDYTVVLAHALTQQDRPVAVVSLMEEKDNDDDEADFPFAHLRLTARQTWPEKAALLKSWLVTEKPDVISLQYVPYAYNARGLPFGFSRWLKGLAGAAQFHIMFHELWVAAEQGARFKNCILGKIQMSIIRNMLQSLNPVSIQTSNLVYQELLKRIGFKASILPLFSNIAPAPNPPPAWPILQAKGLDIHPGNRDTLLIAALFGTLHPSWNPKRAIELLKQAASLSQKSPVLIMTGNNGVHATGFREALATQHPDITVVATGKLSVPELSSVLSVPDFGFSAAPWALAGKSSAGLALLSHGLPLIFTDDRWRLRRGTTPLPEPIDGCYLDEPDLAQRIATGLPKPGSVPSTEAVAELMYQSINTKTAPVC